MKNDWPAIAKQIEQYLDSLDPTQRPMTCAALAIAHGYNSHSLFAYAQDWPHSEIARVYRRYRQADAEWMLRLADTLTDALATKRKFADVAEEWGLELSQVENHAVTLRKWGVMPPPRRPKFFSVHEVLKLAQKGMTRRELADALGIKFVRLENWMLPCSAHVPFNRELQTRIKWTREGKKGPLRIASIRRSR